MDGESLGPGEELLVERGEELRRQRGVELLPRADPAYRAHELQYVLAQSGAVGIFYVDTYRDVALRPIIEQSVRGRRCASSSRSATGRSSSSR